MQSAAVPHNLRKLRRERLISQIEMAQRSGVSRATISRAENGEHMRFATIRKLAEILGVPPGKLLGLDNADQH